MKRYSTHKDRTNLFLKITYYFKRNLQIDYNYSSSLPLFEAWLNKLLDSIYLFSNTIPKKKNKKYPIIKKNV